MLFIQILFHLSPYKDFKHFYLYDICHEHRDKFKKVPCYQRLLALKKSLFMPLTLLMYALFGEETGLYFADSTALKEIIRTLSGKCYADRGYIGQNLFQSLWKKGLHLITRIRKNMKNYLLPHVDKLLLEKLFIIEMTFVV